MALSAVVLTAQRLQNLTDDQIRDLRDLIPALDRCGDGPPPTRAGIARYVTDPEQIGLRAIGILDGTAPYGAVLYRRENGVAYVMHWYCPLGRTTEIGQVLVPLARTAGISELQGHVRNQRVRDRLATFDGVNVDGSPVSIVIEGTLVRALL